MIQGVFYRPAGVGGSGRREHRRSRMGFGGHAMAGEIPHERVYRANDVRSAAAVMGLLRRRGLSPTLEHDGPAHALRYEVRIRAFVRVPTNEVEAARGVLLAADRRRRRRINGWARSFEGCALLGFLVAAVLTGGYAFTMVGPWTESATVAALLAAWLFLGIVLTTVLARSLPPAELAEEDELVCEECGYRLRGLVTPRCPECGRDFGTALLLELGLPHVPDDPPSDDSTSANSASAAIPPP